MPSRNFCRRDWWPIPSGYDAKPPRQSRRKLRLRRRRARLSHSPSTCRRCPSRISSAMLVRDSRTSSANGALGRHERQDSTEDEAWRIATNYSQVARLAAPGGNVKQLRAGLNLGTYLFRIRAAQRCRRGRRFGLGTPDSSWYPPGAAPPLINELTRPHLSGAKFQNCPIPSASGADCQGN